MESVIGSEACGCKIIEHHDKYMSPFIRYCPKHQSASDLYEAAKLLQKSKSSRHYNLLWLATAKAEDKNGN